MSMTSINYFINGQKAQSVGQRNVIDASNDGRYDAIDRVPQDDGAEHVWLGWIPNDGYWRHESDGHWQTNWNLKMIKENVFLTVLKIILTHQQTQRTLFLTVWESNGHINKICNFLPGYTPITMLKEKFIEHIVYDRVSRQAKSISHYLRDILLTRDYTKTAVISKLDITTKWELNIWIDTL